jgi:integrase
MQDLVDRMLAKGLDPSTIRNTLMPLRAVFRRAVGEVGVNPTSAVERPAVRGRRDRIATAEEAEMLISALEQRDRALWATACYGGLRRGELAALRVEDVDLAAGRIRVERSWDVQEGPVEPKSRAGRRTVPIPAVLRDYLDEHLLSLGRDHGLVFGRTADTAFDPPTVDARAKSAWKRGRSWLPRKGATRSSTRSRFTSADTLTRV